MSDAVPIEPSNDLTKDTQGSEFVSLIVQYRHAIYAFIAKQLVHPADAEDVFQKTNLVLWSKMAEFDSGGSFFHWACGVAMNEVRNHRRRQGRSRLYFDSDLAELIAEESRAEAESTQARLDALNACMKELSPRQRQILRRCYDGTSTISEVASSLDRSRDALYKQLARLRDKLSDCIRRQIAAEDFAP